MDFICRQRHLCGVDTGQGDRVVPLQLLDRACDAEQRPPQRKALRDGTPWPDGGQLDLAGDDAPDEYYPIPIAAGPWMIPLFWLAVLLLAALLWLLS